MRITVFSLMVLTITAASASAQQTSVDIAVSSATFLNGGVQAQVLRKDPPDVKIEPKLKPGPPLGGITPAPLKNDVEERPLPTTKRQRRTPRNALKLSSTRI